MPAGRSHSSGNASHAVQLQADAHGAESERVTLRLLFRAQDAELPRTTGYAADDHRAERA